MHTNLYNMDKYSKYKNWCLRCGLACQFVLTDMSYDHLGSFDMLFINADQVDVLFSKILQTIRAYLVDTNSLV